MEIKNGSKVKVHYTGSFEDGKVFDTSEGKEPLEFEVGSGKLIKGFDSALIGMKKGEEKEITLKPEEAYGEKHDNLMQEVPKEALKGEFDPKEGMQLMLKAPDGHQMVATIIKVGDEKLTIDMNHPLAGKTLKFKLNVVSVEEKSENESAPEEEPTSEDPGKEPSEEKEE
ncbi:MAG: peptidylprolyl isomerase [Nanoarchaeota archaeon]|nr:peptidylprolyl isomerase [Nanoarchaeota archaeon]MCK5630101.1 peptidylprolyl isomerase [Nanoarchaeota archaeon]